MSNAHVLIVVQNLPVPLDRRVWLECGALTGAGYEVSVICPKGPGDPDREVIDGVHIYKYPPPPPAEGVLGYTWEFAYCWLRTAALSLTVWRQREITVLQACNPPDTYWLLGLLWRSRGVRFVFDHHDLNPEVFLSRFGEPAGVSARAQLSIIRWLERRTFAAADRVVSTNDSYRALAVSRGGVAREHTAVVRSGPDTAAMRPVPAEPELRRGGTYLVVYLGIMGPQDGVDGVLDAAERIIRTHGRTDVRFALLGFGDCLDDLQRRCTAMGLDEYVHFTGRVGPTDIARYLSTASVGLCPDPLSPLNDISTMNKTMEYMAYALPVVAYELRETVVSGGDCAVYVAPGDAAGLADRVVELLDDPLERARRGAAGRRRAETVLDWTAQAATYVGVYDELLGRKPVGVETAGRPVPPTGRWIDIADDRDLEHFAAQREGRTTITAGTADPA